MCNSHDLEIGTMDSESDFPVHPWVLLYSCATFSCFKNRKDGFLFKQDDTFIHEILGVSLDNSYCVQHLKPDTKETQAFSL